MKIMCITEQDEKAFGDFMDHECFRISIILSIRYKLSRKRHVVRGFHGPSKGDIPDVLNTRYNQVLHTNYCLTYLIGYTVSHRDQRHQLTVTQKEHPDQSNTANAAYRATKTTCKPTTIGSTNRCPGLHVLACHLR